MVRTLDAGFITEKNKEENKPVFLYTIYDYDGSSNNLYFTSYDTNLTFDSVEYVRFPITHDQTGENSSGEIDNIRLRVANTNRAIQYYLELYDWSGKKVKITTVFANTIDDADIKKEDIYYISDYLSTQDVAEFTCTSKFNVLQIKIPSRIYMRTFCSWKFKGTECAYAGAETECNKTKTRCKELSNYQRFGGFPSIPERRIYA
jgi:lambda family phage minor tail protein L